MLIENAWAQDAVGTAAGGGMLALAFSYLPLILIFIIFYALIIRPQGQAAKAQKAMLGALTKGDKVQTIGGLVGDIAQVNDGPTGDYVRVTVAPGVTMTVLKSAIAARLESGAVPMATKAGPVAGTVIDVPVTSGNRKGKK